MLTRTSTSRSSETVRAPWSNVPGLARSLLALGLLLTLSFTGNDVLFDRASLARMAQGSNPFVLGNLFVLLRDHLVIAKLLAVAILAVTVSGWRPRWTAALHWWVAMSFGFATQAADGGDHVHVVLSTLLLPVGLTDPRRWHWQRAPRQAEPSWRQEIVRFAAASCLVMAVVQMAVIYFHAAVGKMAVDEWVNGTATYYWFTDPSVGAPAWLLPWLEPVLASSAGVLALTWGTLALELVLCFAPLTERRYRRWFLVAGIAFHAGIIVIHGLVSFFFSMAAGLILLLRRPDEPFAVPAWLRRAAALATRHLAQADREAAEPAPMAAAAQRRALPLALPAEDGTP